MKKVILGIICIIVLLGYWCIENNSVSKPIPVKQKITIDTLTRDTVIQDTAPVYEQKTFDEFLNKLAWRESRGNWKIVNRFGYMGKYQIGKLALRDIGMDSINASDFKAHPEIFPEELQDIAIKKYIKKNRLYLKEYITKYSNTYVHGVWITESGIIGAAHLVGQRNVKEWLDCCNDWDRMDANGVHAESYFKMFANYKIS